MFNTNQWKGPNIVPDIVVLHFYESISFLSTFDLISCCNLWVCSYGWNVSISKENQHNNWLQMGLLDRESEPKRFVIPSSRLGNTDRLVLHCSAPPTLWFLHSTSPGPRGEEPERTAATVAVRQQGASTSLVLSDSSLIHPYAPDLDGREQLCPLTTGYSPHLHTWKEPEFSKQKLRLFCPSMIVPRYLKCVLNHQ